MACRVALYYTSIGLQVDTLALIGAPINPSLLAAVQADGSIANVIVVNLTEFGDPIFAGMSDMGLVVNVPALIGQMLTEGEPTGHFHYSGSGTDESLMRKRLLIADLVGQGLQ